MTAHLPQLDRLFLTDAGLESDMIFNKGLDLPCFSSLMLMRSSEGRWLPPKCGRAVVRSGSRARPCTT